MKKLIFLASAVLALCCSCSTTYYYSTLNSNNNHVFKTKEGDFVTENDSLYIIYSFFGEDAPINIGVYNKSNQPLYVDWSQSAIIIDGVAEPDGDNEVVTYGNTTYVHKTIEVNGEVFSSYEPQMKTVSKNLSFIPPKSQVNHTSYRLANFPFENIPNEAYVEKNFANIETTTKVKTIDFNESESPLRFRSYITVYTNHPSKPDSKRYSFEQSFYMSSLIKAKGDVPPEYLLAYQKKSGDFFYVKYYKESGFGQAMAVIGISAAVIAVDVITDPSTY